MWCKVGLWRHSEFAQNLEVGGGMQAVALRGASFAVPQGGEKIFNGCLRAGSKEGAEQDFFGEVNVGTFASVGGVFERP